MTIKYHPLLQLSSIHGYSSEGDAAEVIYQPTADTQRIMQRLDLRARELATGVAIYYGEREGKGALLSVNETVALNFIIRPKDPLFWNFTNLPLDGIQGQVYHFSNVDASTSFEVDQTGLLPFRAAQFTIQLAGDVSLNSLRLVGEIGNVLYPYPEEMEDGQPIIQIVSHVKNEAGEIVATNLGIDIKTNPAGKYRLFQGEEMVFACVAVHDSLAPMEAIGVMTIFLGEVGDGEWRLKSPQGIEQKNYQVAFSARKTIWRYHLINNLGETEQDEETYQIQNEKNIPVSGELFITDTTPTTLPNGQQAITLVAQVPMTLQRREETYFKLVLQKSGLSLSLPNAAAQQIKHENEKNQDGTIRKVYYSDLYVYI